MLTPVNTIDFFDMKMRGILCKPHFRAGSSSRVCS
jgi:hypothetical protein